MCKKVEGVLAEGTTMDPRCEVVMDGKGYVSDDFVAILAKENGDASIYYNTDALTLGMAMKMVAKHFVESMAMLSDEERESVEQILGDAFMSPKQEVVAADE